MCHSLCQAGKKTVAAVRCNPSFSLHGFEVKLSFAPMCANTSSRIQIIVTFHQNMLFTDAFTSTFTRIVLVQQSYDCGFDCS